MRRTRGQGREKAVCEVTRAQEATGAAATTVGVAAGAMIAETEVAVGVGVEVGLGVGAMMVAIGGVAKALAR